MRRFLIMVAVGAAAVTGCDERISGPMVEVDGALYAKGGKQQETSAITYAVELSATAYDAEADVTEFTYVVTSNPNGGPAISHWTLALPAEAGAGVVVGSSDPATEWVDPDPTTGVTGVKFDTGYQDGETRSVSVTLDGRWSTGDAVIAVKAGNGFVTGTVDGPVAERPAASGMTVRGVVFLDFDGDGGRDAGEPALPGVEVSTDGVSVVSDGAGGYIFAGLDVADYTVTAAEQAALGRTTAGSVEAPATEGEVVVDFGYSLDVATIGGRTADGRTIGFWKNNVAKVMAGRTKGVQVDPLALKGYVATLGDFILAPYDGLTLSSAVAFMESVSPAADDLLAKQLLASELNYVNGAWIDGDAVLTYAFVAWGEYLLADAGARTRAELIAAKDWFDAYNNSHGGIIVTP